MDFPVKETRLADVRIFRCRGPVASLRNPAPPGETWDNLRRIFPSDESHIIVGAEGSAIGWVRLSVRPGEVHGFTDVWADALIDYESEARLMAENGELGLRVDLENLATAIIATKSPILQWVPGSHPFKLTPVENDWKSLFSED